MGILDFWRSTTSDWRVAADHKKRSTYEQIPLRWRVSDNIVDQAEQNYRGVKELIESLLSAGERKITSWAAPEIAEYVRQRQITALEVTEAFCHRAALAHQLVGCMHEIFFDTALSRAARLDAFQMENNSVMGPLHGVPISLKDQFHIADVETTMGYVGWINTFEGQKGSSEYNSQESTVVKHLMALGAVLYCKTSLPQTLLLGETRNNIFGYTTNPWNTRLSCGGSSGGEGALITAGGSCLGIGTDIGGSVRIPAAFCGIFSIKPSIGRFSYKSMANSNPGQTIVQSVVGFMASSLLSLRLIQVALLSQCPWLDDSEVLPIPWRSADEAVEDVLCFAILYDDGYCMPHPPVTRGLREVEAALVDAGHEVIQWRPPPHRDGSHLHNKFMNCDGGHNVWQQLDLSGEPLLDKLVPLFGTKPKDPMCLTKFQSLALEREAYRQRYNDYWNSTTKYTGTGRPVDGVIMAVAPHAAVLPGKYYHYDYSDIVNLLDYTSIVIPVSRVDGTIDVPDAAYQPRNKIDQQNWEAYDSKAYDGAPIGVQIIARRLQEERCFGLAKEVVNALSEKQRG